MTDENTLDDTLSESFDSMMADPEPQEADNEDLDVDESLDSDEVIEEDQPEVDEIEEEVEEDLDPIEPPERWSAADKAVFESLPRDAQELVLKRESDVESYLTKRSQEQAETKKRFDALDQVLEPRREQWGIEGLNESQVIGQLFSISDYADKDPVGFVNWFAQQRGLDLTNMANQPQVDPALLQTQQELAQVKQSIAERERAQADAQKEAADKEIQAFADSGEYPHFDTLRVDMAHRMQTGEATDLKQAYDQVVWANPETRQLMQDEIDEAKKVEAAKKAKKAKKVAETQLESSGTGVSETTSSIDDTLSKSYDHATNA